MCKTGFDSAPGCNENGKNLQSCQIVRTARCVYVYLSHNLIEAVQLGALAHVVVDGDWDDDLMAQVQAPGPIPV